MSGPSPDLVQSAVTQINGLISEASGPSAGDISQTVGCTKGCIALVLRALPHATSCMQLAGLADKPLLTFLTCVCSPADACFLSFVHQVDCPPGIVGRIIGRGGETIRGLQQASGAHIVVNQVSLAAVW